MNLKPVDSSRMSKVGWNENKMYIQFHNGDIYAYSNVSYDEYIKFISSPSLGSELESFQQKHPYHKI